MVLIANPNLFSKVLTTSINLALAIVNFVTMYRSSMVAIVKLSIVMEIANTSCVLRHPDLLVARFIFSQLLW